MKYIKRILIILFLVIMISGCTVNYNLKINKDLSVNEKVVASENTNRLKSRTKLSVEQSVKYLYDGYKLDTMKDNGYSITDSGTVTEVTVNNTYKSITDYSNAFENELFELLVNAKDKNKIELNYNQLDLIDTTKSSRYVYDKIEVTIEVPFDVIESNADTVNGNTYKWIINADSKEYKNIHIVLNGEKVKNTVSLPFGDNLFSIGYEWILLVVVVIVIIAVIIIVYSKNKKNNRF